MRSKFVNIVQKCICVDFLLNSLISSNHYSYLKFLYNMKDENLRNIKLICYLYECIYNDDLIIDDINPIKLNKHSDNTFKILFKFTSDILDDLQNLKTIFPSVFYYQIINKLRNSYFTFSSSLNYFCSLNYDKTLHSSPPRNLSLNDIRESALNSINLFFDYSLINNPIVDESYEVFFENNPESKFHQFFFKSTNKRFKVRAWDKNGFIFYIYQLDEIAPQVEPSLDKDDAKNFIISYLKEKLPDEYNFLHLDDTFLNITSYMNIPETYKFKFNYKDGNGKVNFKKGIYITIDSKHTTIQEIIFF